MICIFLFFVIFSFSFQTIPTSIFCDDSLKEIYVVEGSTHRQVEHGSNGGGSWNRPYYFNLDVVEGDLIRFKCYNNLRGAYGGGCFFLNNKCYCYEFDNDIGWNNDYATKSANLCGTTCIVNIHYLNRELSREHFDYYYEHYIPLDATKISCKNDNKVLVEV